MSTHRGRGAAERRVEPPDSLDDFPTPPWAARAIAQHVKAQGWADFGSSVWEPAANRGAFWHGLSGEFDCVHASDIFAYPDCAVRNIHTPVDFLLPGSESDDPIDWVMTNPPFRLAAEFAERALQVARVGCALLVRNAFVEGEGRYAGLFSTLPPTQLVYFSERVVMLKGRLIRAGEIDPVASRDKGKEVKASTNRASMVAIWVKDHARMPCDWIPPGSRLRLEQEGDYELW